MKFELPQRSALRAPRSALRTPFASSVLSALCALLLSVPVLAQPVPLREPSSTHIFPAGGQRGTTVSVRVGGECLPPETTFRIWGDDVTAPAVLGPRIKLRYEPSPRRDPTEIPISY